MLSTLNITFVTCTNNFLISYLKIQFLFMQFSMSEVTDSVFLVKFLRIFF